MYSAFGFYKNKWQRIIAGANRMWISETGQNITEHQVNQGEFNLSLDFITGWDPEL
jgi:hypothetical protein